MVRMVLMARTVRMVRMVLTARTVRMVRMVPTARMALTVLTPLAMIDSMSNGIENETFDGYGAV